MKRVLFRPRADRAPRASRVRVATVLGLFVGLSACGLPGATPTSSAVAAPERGPTSASRPAAVAPETIAPEAPTSVPTIAGVRGEVVLVALGTVPAAHLDAVESHLRTYAAVEVRRLDALALPKSAWTAKRRRYRAERLLDFLLEQIPGTPPTTRILGLTDVDISTTKPPHDDWGIFGLGQSPGQAAVVSTFRLRRGARDSAHVVRRLTNTALHEVGHTFGLGHCTEPRCPMQDAEGGITNTDTADDVFAPECAAELEDRFPRQDQRLRATSSMIPP